MAAIPACSADGGVSTHDSGPAIVRPPPGPDGGGRADGTVMLPTDAATADGLLPTDDGATAAGDAGAASFPFCRITCDTVASCVQPSPAYDEDNYRCTDNLCEYTGCRSDDECQAVFMSSAWLCRDLGGLPTCQQACASTSDCGQGTAAFDADNYTCDDGVCRYVGCSNDSECASTFMDDRYVCRDVLPPDTGLPLPIARMNCVRSCATSAECASPSAAYDADNYACDDGACRYIGCHDDGECRASLMNDAYVCR